MTSGSWLPRFLAPRGAVRSPERRAGDLARERRDWLEAARQYRRHLSHSARDVAIWVQLGHALKEAGDLPEALAAYREASRLRPNDVDALLSLGQLLRASGDRGAAIDCFQRAAGVDGDERALEELEREGIAADCVRATVGQRDRHKVLEALRAHCQGLVPVRASDVRLDEGGLAFLSRDPWIEFRPSGPRAPIALLAIHVISRSPDHELMGQIYVGHDHGYNERQSVRYGLDGGRAAVLVVDPGSISSLRWDPDRSPGGSSLPTLSLHDICSVEDLDAVLDRIIPADEDSSQLRALLRDHIIHFEQGTSSLLPRLISFGADQVVDSMDYTPWMLRNETRSAEDHDRAASALAAFAYRPTFSFVMPTYNTPITLLRQCLDALLAQTYTDFELCVADDCSTDPRVIETLRAYAERDERVKVVARAFNGHISAASNSALALATGEFVVLVDHDDLVPDYALAVIADYLNRFPDADILYSDEDKITTTGKRLEPYFKSEFNKYLLYGHNMISHLGVYRRSLVEKVGGFRLGLEGSQDYDLFLRCYERTRDDRVIHVPHVLYHWRILPGSTAMSADQKSYAVLAAQAAINGHFERTGMPLRSMPGFVAGLTAVKPTREFDTPLSIIIPTRNGREVLEPCLQSVLARPHEAVELIVVDNGSDDPATLAYLDDLACKGTIRLLRHSEAFNFSTINNVAAEAASGQILCFLNNDTEVVGVDWLNRARAFLSIDEVGAVGARLIFPDGTLQHFGIALGMGAHGVAGTPHGGMDADQPGYFGKARLLQEFAAVTAACLFVRKADFDAAGGFDPALGVAYNDVDLCLRLRERGLRVIADPDIVLIHKESRTRGTDHFGERAERLAREAAQMRDRWGALLRNDPFFSPNHDLARSDFSLAANPRVPLPWRREPEAREHATSVVDRAG